MAHVNTEELKQKIDVKDLLEEYSLDKIQDDGEWVKATCPYHNDTNPSFCMRKKDTYFHCWSCDAKGDAIQFIMDMENMDFKQALEKLVNITGYVVTSGSQIEYLKRVWLRKESPTTEPLPAILEDHRILELNRKAHTYFTHSIKGSLGEKYLLGRGFDRNAIEEGEVGFCTKEFIKMAVNEWKYSHDELYIAGFLRGDASERFLNRIIFPVYNENKNIVAFSARTVTDEEPKYTNTPNSLYYRKSAVLFGLQKLRHGEPIVLVEGNLDWLRLLSKGINCLGNLGSTLTIEQADLLSKYTDTVTLLYDGDDAGRKASRNAFMSIIEKGIRVNLVNLPDGQDPDTFLKNDNVIDSIDALVYYVEYNRAQGLHDVRILSLLLKKVSKIQDRQKRGYYIERLSEVFNLSLETVQSELKKS